MSKPIDGAENIPMTAEPDEAEIAAQAVLEIILEKKEASSKKHQKRGNTEVAKAQQPQDNTEHDADYYRHLAERIREAYAAARQRALRSRAIVSSSWLTRPCRFMARVPCRSSRQSCTSASTSWSGKAET